MVIPYTKFEDFGIIRFLVMLRRNRTTDADECFTHVTVIGLSSYVKLAFT